MNHSLKSQHAVSLRVLILVVALVFFSSSAWAHFPWINAADYTPPAGSALDLTIGWGHAYPFAPFLKKEGVGSLTMTGPDKHCPTLLFESDIEITSDASLTKPGAYIVSATRIPGFHTKTAQGYKSSSKKGLDQVLSCSFSHMSMKAVINVGDGKGSVDMPVGHDLEIFLLKNPVDVRAGENMPVRVLYKQKPWSGMIYATYAGFSTEKETFAYATKTDKKGEAIIRMLQPGVWLIKASQEEAYPDPSECDIESFVASLTFEVK